jgi:hypothetical protein
MKYLENTQGSQVTYAIWESGQSTMQSITKSVPRPRLRRSGPDGHGKRHWTFKSTLNDTSWRKAKKYILRYAGLHTHCSKFKSINDLFWLSDQPPILLVSRYADAL